MSHEEAYMHGFDFWIPLLFMKKKKKKQNCIKSSLDKWFSETFEVRSLTSEDLIKITR